MVCAAIGRAQLVLDAALPPKVNGLDGMRRAGDLPGRPMAPGESIQRAQQRDDDRG
jgi:hypothetical protein